MHIAPTSIARVEPPVATFAVGQRIGQLQSYTSSGRAAVIADAPLEPATTFATREDAFKSAYDATLGAAAGAVLIGNNGRGFTVQHMHITDGTNSAELNLELAGSANDLYLARGTAAGVVAIIDGSHIIVPRD